MWYHSQGGDKEKCSAETIRLLNILILITYLLSIFITLLSVGAFFCPELSLRGVVLQSTGEDLVALNSYFNLVLINKKRKSYN